MNKWVRYGAVATMISAAAAATAPGGNHHALAEGAPPSPAAAQNLGTIYRFSIGAQPLGTALTKYSSAAHVHLKYTASEIAGKTSGGIEGNYSILESLTRLLAGTGLSFKQSEQGLVIAPTETAAGRAPSSDASPLLRAAWRKFTAAVEEARVATEQTTRFRTEPWTRAKAYHALMEAEAMAYNFAVSPRLDYPRIQEATAWQLNNYTLGLNGADGFYGVLLLDGRQTYRVTGRIGQLRLLLMQVLSHVFGSPDTKNLGNYNFSKFKMNADGTFDVILSAARHDGNWIRLDPESSDNWIIIRRWMADWNDDQGALHVAMISKPASGFYNDDEFSDAAMAKRIETAAYLVKYLVDSFNVGLYDMFLNAADGQVNRLVLLPGTTTSPIGSPTSQYALGIFDLAPDEALIMRMDKIPSDAAYWSFQLSDVWNRSLDFMNRKTSINMSEAFIGPDGKFWAVVSSKDPGIVNWLDTTGHPDGTISFRNYRSKTPVVPVVWKVKFADIWKYLPKDTARVTPEQRQAEIAHRRAGIIKTYGGVF